MGPHVLQNYRYGPPGIYGPELSEHVHEFASRADTCTHVIVLGRTTSRDVWVVVRCTVGEGERWSAKRSIILYLSRCICVYCLNISSQPYCVTTVLRVVALWLSSVHVFTSRADTHSFDCTDDTKRRERECLYRRFPAVARWNLGAHICRFLHARSPSP